MKVTNKVLFMAIISMFLIFGVTGQGNAAWPEKPITVVVQYKAGGGTDMIMRTLANEMGKYLKCTINVINRPGGTGSMATNFVWNKPPDGYWWLGASQWNKSLRVVGSSNLAPWRDWQFFKAGAGKRCGRGDLVFRLPDRRG